MEQEKVDNLTVPLEVQLRSSTENRLLQDITQGFGLSFKLANQSVKRIGPAEQNLRVRSSLGLGTEISFFVFREIRSADAKRRSEQIPSHLLVERSPVSSKWIYN